MNNDENKNNQTPDPSRAVEPETNNGLEKCEKEKAEYLSGWQRAKADFINYKKEEIKRLEEIAKYGNEDLIKDLITVLDNFDLGLLAMESMRPAPTLQSESRPSGVGIEKGIYMIRTQIEDILKQRGLEKIPIKIGEAFDPGIAEAIAEAESSHPPGSIIEEIEPGYKLYDKILRPARVRIAKTK